MAPTSISRRELLNACTTGSLVRSCVRLMVTASFAAAVAHVGVTTVAAQAQSIKEWTPESTFSIKRIQSVVPSPDGTKVAFVVSDAVMDGEQSEWRSQVHVANADGSDSRQLTRGEKSATIPRWSPDGKWIGFLSSRSGSPNVWRINVGGGEAEQITSEKAGISSFDWSPDGASIAFVMADLKSDGEEKAAKEKRDWRTLDENVKMNRLYVQPVTSGALREGQARKLTTGNYSVDDFDWSPDGRTIVFQHQPTPAVNDWVRSDISIVSVADGAARSLIASSAPEQTPRFSPDGSRIAFLGSEPSFVWAGAITVSVVPASGGPAQALAATFDMSPVLMDWTADGKRVLVAEAKRTVPMIYAVPVDGSTPVAVSPPKMHVATPALNTRGTHMGFMSQDFDKAPEAFIAKVDGGFSAVQVSHVQPAIEAATGRSEVITWTSADGQPIEGIVTYPTSYQRGTRVPLLVNVHGGPTQVFMNTFIGNPTQYPAAIFASRGYAILRVNPRGSSGYGKAFRYANIADWGGGDYRDIMTGVDHLVAIGLADPDRLGVMGWSYGGFMTSWIVTQTNRFKAASAGAPVTDLISMNGTTDIPDFIPDYFKGEFWKVFESWRAHSPLMNVGSVTTPTLLQHGEADVRVPTSQSYEFYTALKRQGVTTKLTVYPRQGHAFAEPKMLQDVERANLEWFDRFVMGKTPSTQ